MDNKLEKIIQELKSFQGDLEEIQSKAHSYEGPLDYGTERFEAFKERLIEYIGKNINMDRANKLSDVSYPKIILTRGVDIFYKL